METMERLTQYILREKLFTSQDRLLLGVSGGKDSMLMAFLLWKLGYSIAIAHCNFKLRGVESELDEQLVREFSETHHIPYYTTHFDTKLHAEEHKLSIQMSARELRYQWFENLRQTHHFDAIAVAHHQQDHIETVFINLARGTGLRGLRGIASKRDQIIRPILWMSSQEIAQAVATYQVPYRDDQSNFSNKYVRNKVRLDILPQFRVLNANFDQIMLDNIERFTDSYDLLQRLTGAMREKLFISIDGRIEIEKILLEPYLNDTSLLFELFRPYNFEKNVLADLAESGLHKTGSQFESESHLLMVDRTHLLLYSSNHTPVETQYLEQGDAYLAISGRTLSFSISTDTTRDAAPHTAKVDLEALIFPLMIRRWMPGDRFIPLGMNSSKKLSDFFIQRKVPLLEKERVPVLINGNGEIIWIVGYQLDNRYRIKENTKKVATFVYR
ncbi:tRNA lysidine(34) synthetase TilS [Sphingobacterium sp. lm-10]|uniref:tRNA lysidine(34) synthetase TilS n=1 Tax=Sphingobacterium sp. lm-10 TaxID=2944904 RepID=UPI0020215229|nr:tRNA lysidine(34) synthetase TilS [Sphingobacterium sp. lm-10]MCL7988174.1 tRNA lysidine(34) synthetase TilS [Sphingobacterium sp. lm-10]